MSLGYQGQSRSVRKAISDALARGIVVVASSGNSGGSSGTQRGNAPYSFPADYPGVLGVGAVAQTGLPAGFSSNNLSVQVAAPGVRVPAQGRDGQYWLVSGTSPACALTAGVAALIKSVYPTLAPALVVQAITASTANKPHGGYDEQVGFGTVDATTALKLAGRLVRDRGTGRGLVAAAQFGGGAAAIPPVPVTPRGKSQLVTYSVVALLCLAIALAIGFRLIVTRRVPVATAPAGPRPPGTGARGAAWTGAGHARYRTPADHRPAGGHPAPPDHGPPDGYATPVGYQSPAAYRPGGNYPPRPPSGSPGGYGSQDGSQAPTADRPAVGYGPPGDYGFPAGYGSATGSGPPTGDQPPGDQRPGGTEAPGSFPDRASARPRSGYRPAGPPASPDGAAEGPPPADDDAWPSSGQW
jgi:hypothetical protein